MVNELHGGMPFWKKTPKQKKADIDKKVNDLTKSLKEYDLKNLYLSSKKNLEHNPGVYIEDTMKDQLSKFVEMYESYDRIVVAHTALNTKDQTFGHRIQHLDRSVDELSRLIKSNHHIFYNVNDFFSRNPKLKVKEETEETKEEKKEETKEEKKEEEKIYPVNVDQYIQPAKELRDKVTNLMSQLERLFKSKNEDIGRYSNIMAGMEQKNEINQDIEKLRLEKQVIEEQIRKCKSIIAGCKKIKDMQPFDNNKTSREQMVESYGVYLEVYSALTPFITEGTIIP